MMLAHSGGTLPHWVLLAGLSHVGVPRLQRKMRRGTSGEYERIGKEDVRVGHVPRVTLPHFGKHQNDEI
jgi:hypothetical protein